MHTAPRSSAWLRGCASALLWAAASAAVSPASAAVVSGTLSFTASYVGSFNPPPVPLVVGSFDITFDNAADVAQTTSGISVNSLNITLGSAIAFGYDQSSDLLKIGGISNGIGAVNFNEFDLGLTVLSFSTAPSSDLFIATFGDGVFYGYTPVVTVTFSPTQSVPVPEPLSLALVGAGLAGLAMCRRRRPAGNDQVQPV